MTVAVALLDSDPESLMAEGDRGRWLRGEDVNDGAITMSKRRLVSARVAGTVCMAAHPGPSAPRAPLALTLCLALRAAMATTSLARPHWTDAAALDLSCDSAASLLLLLLLFPVSEPVPCTGA